MEDLKEMGMPDGMMELQQQDIGKLEISLFLHLILYQNYFLVIQLVNLVFQEQVINVQAAQRKGFYHLDLVLNVIVHVLLANQVETINVNHVQVDFI